MTLNLIETFQQIKIKAKTHPEHQNTYNFSKVSKSYKTYIFKHLKLKQKQGFISMFIALLICCVEGQTA